MAERKQPIVLDVGQCDLDHGNIRRLLSDAFGADVQRARSIDDAVQSVTASHFDLVLVNRIFDESGEEGLEFVRRLRAVQADGAPPIMLVSNYEDAQEAAVAAGAVRGFGKNALGDPKTVEMLSTYLQKE